MKLVGMKNKLFESDLTCECEDVRRRVSVGPPFFRIRK